MNPAGTDISATQRTVLSTLKRAGEATADELATQLEISSSAVRQHLNALRHAGLIDARRERGHAGRPAERYRATELSEPLFVNDQRDLSIQLLRHVEAEDPQLVTRIFDRRRQELVERTTAKLDGRPLAERVEILTEMLDEQGYLADSEQLAPDHYRINLHNCAIWEVASRYRQACTTELEFLQGLIPDATVQRLTHKTSGAHTCAYDISAGT